MGQTLGLYRDHRLGAGGVTPILAELVLGPGN